MSRLITTDVDWPADPDGFAPTGRLLSRTMLLGIVVTVLLVGAALSAIAPKHLSKGFVACCVILATILLAAQLIHKATGPRPVNWLTVEILFLIAFYIAHFVYPAYWVLGVVASNSRVWIDESVVGFGTALGLVGMAAFMLGFHILPEYLGRVHWPAVMQPDTLRRWSVVGRVVLVAGVITGAAFVGLLGRELVEGQYKLDRGYDANLLWLVFNLLIRLGIVVVTLAAVQRTGRWKVGLIVKVLLVLFIGWTMILGQRGVFATTALLVLAAYAEYVRRVSLKVLLILLTGGMFIHGVAAVARNSPERTISSFVKTAIAKSEDIRWDSGVMDLSSSVRTLYGAVHFVPDVDGYGLGRMKISEVTSIIPFGNALFGMDKWAYPSSGIYLTWKLEGSLAVGAGSTVVADIWVDFGYVGVLVLMIALGLLCKRVQQRARADGSSFTWGVAHMFLIVTLPLMARGNLLQPIRGVLWPVIGVCVLGWVFGLPRRGSVEYQSEIECLPVPEDYPST
jgi:hypothetical protein